MKEKIAGISVFVNLILAIGKIIAGLLAKSASVLAEGVHSGMDVISSGISLTISGSIMLKNFATIVQTPLKCSGRLRPQSLLPILPGET